jgi:hypothetical protein
MASRGSEQKFRRAKIQNHQTSKLKLEKQDLAKAQRIIQFTAVPLTFGEYG